jgi:hypothetical protein
MEGEYTAAGIEPPLEELLDDQIARLVMRRDGIGPADVWRSVEQARSRLAQRARKPAATAIAELSPALGTDSRVSPSSG